MSAMPIAFVEIECPGDQLYESCASACPDTCLEPQGSQICATLCIEACICPEGLVREGDKCISASECGCRMDNGIYLPVSKKQFISEADISERMVPPVSSVETYL